MTYRRVLVSLLLTAGYVVAGALVSGCAGAPSGKIGICKECYDALEAMQTSHPAWGSMHNQVIRTYECPCCKTEMTVYIEQGVPKVKCGGCAKDGVSWGECTLVDHPQK